MIPVEVAGVVVSRVVADSRRAGPGSLFVALPGRCYDGHDFLEDARRRGAVAALCARGRGRAIPGLTVIEADEPLAALGALARRVRASSRATVVGVAGSAGKTCTKDILRALCAPHAATIASEASFNNELGVPLTLCLLEPATKVAVCELGTGAAGELAALCALAEPDLGVLTCLGPEHLEAFGTLEGVAREEAALLAALPPGASVVLPAHEPLLAPHARADLAEVRFGLEPDADLRPLRWLPGDDGTEVELSVRGRRVAFRTNLRAPHHRLNLCAAVAAYAALGLPLEGVGEGAGAIALSPWRDQERRRADGGLVLNDAYNANPVSMRAALAALAARRDGGRAVAVLGEMAELGPAAPAWHRLVGELAAASGIDLLVGIGPLARCYLDGAGRRVDSRWFAGVDEAAAGLAGLVLPGDVVLLKASRAAGLERLDEALP